MLPKINRLRIEKDFENVFKNGKSSEDQLLKIKFLRNQRSNSRLGFIVGVKISKKATLRNFLKRRLRQAAHLLLKDVKSGYDIVILPKTSIIRVPYKELSENLKNLLTKNDLLSI